MSADADVRAARERPIIFSAPMVRALLGGRKTQTRRVLKPQPFVNGFGFDGHEILCHCDYLPPATMLMRSGHGKNACLLSDCEDGPEGFAGKYVGDRLWVRETWKPHSTFAGVPPREIPPSKIFYAADDAYAPSGGPWRSPIHMPRWASRLTLAVTDVRVQRLQEISEADALAEGIHPIPFSNGPNHYTVDVEGGSFSAPTAASVYPMLWSFIHGAAAWDANPWVAAITFEPSRPAAHADGGGRGR